MANKKNVLIAGCGYVGCELARQLLDDGGYAVWGLRRSVDKLPEGVQPIKGDLFDVGQLGTWPDHLDYVVYSAAAGVRDEPSFRRAYIEGLSNVLDKLQKEGHKPQRILFTSSTNSYSQSDGETVDESSQVAPENFWGRIMLEAEQLVTNSPFPATSVRFGGIYGPGREFLINLVKSGQCYPSEPIVYGNSIHRDDCSGILAHLIKRDAAGLFVDTLYLGVDSCPTPKHEVLQWLADQLNIQLSDSAPTRRITVGSKRCLNKRILDTGYTFKFPDFKAGYTDVINGLTPLEEL